MSRQLVRLGRRFTSIDIRKAQSLKGRLSIQTAFDWMKKDSHWRAEVMSATATEEDVLCELAGFIADNTRPQNTALFVWFKDTQENWFRFGMPWIAQRCLASFLKVQNSAAFVHFSTLPLPRIMHLTRGTHLHVTRSLTRSIKRSKSAKSGSA